jgi:hypothetical protein
VLENYTAYAEKLKEVRKENNRTGIIKYDKLLKWLHGKALYYQNRLSRTRGRGMKKSPNSTLSDYYFNSGGCLFEDGITAIEIDDDWIRMVYWHNQVHERVVLWNKPISGIFTSGMNNFMIESGDRGPTLFLSSSYPSGFWG